MNMYKTLEENAKRAKEAYSFRNYENGSATAEYKSYCAQAQEAANRAIAQLKKASAPEERIERVNYLLEKYKVKKFDWLNELFINQAKVPSVMIAGGSNYPTRKKEKQIAREKTIYKNNPDYIIEQIKSMGSEAKVIRSDEKNAAERIKQRIKQLEAMPDPYGNNRANIRRLKERLLDIAPEEFVEEQKNITVNGVKTYEEIVGLWETGMIKKSEYITGEEDQFYYYLPLLFFNGQRRYKELLSYEVDKTGENLRHYNLEKRQTENIPLTDELKYSLIINQINGSGNKKVMYRHLKSLSPLQAAQKAKGKAENEAVTINGEPAEVVRNTDEMRLQLIFDGKPAAGTREKLKSNGFRWAPSQGAWQRLLNNNAEYALNRIKG